jgi:ABC-type transporter Mla subunit MlaD
MRRRDHIAAMVEELRAALKPRDHRRPEVAADKSIELAGLVLDDLARSADALESVATSLERLAAAADQLERLSGALALLADRLAPLNRAEEEQQ